MVIEQSVMKPNIDENRAKTLSALPSELKAWLQDYQSQGAASPLPEDMDINTFMAPDDQDGYIYTPLGATIRYGLHQWAIILIRQGANPDLCCATQENKKYGIFYVLNMQSSLEDNEEIPLVVRELDKRINSYSTNFLSEMCFRRGSDQKILITGLIEKYWIRHKLRAEVEGQLRAVQKQVEDALAIIRPFTDIVMGYCDGFENVLLESALLQIGVWSSKDVETFMSDKSNHLKLREALKSSYEKEEESRSRFELSEQLKAVEKEYSYLAEQNHALEEINKQLQAKSPTIEPIIFALPNEDNVSDQPATELGDSATQSLSRSPTNRISGFSSSSQVADTNNIKRPQAECKTVIETACIQKNKSQSVPGNINRAKTLSALPSELQGWLREYQSHRSGPSLTEDADINTFLAPDHNGYIYTPLGATIKYGVEKWAATLIRHGADLNLCLQSSAGKLGVGIFHFLSIFSKEIEQFPLIIKELDKQPKIYLTEMAFGYMQNSFSKPIKIQMYMMFIRHDDLMSYKIRAEIERHLRVVRAQVEGALAEYIIKPLSGIIMEYHNYYDNFQEKLLELGVFDPQDVKAFLSVAKNNFLTRTALKSSYDKDEESRNLNRSRIELSEKLEDVKQEYISLTKKYCSLEEANKKLQGPGSTTSRQLVNLFDRQSAGSTSTLFTATPSLSNRL